MFVLSFRARVRLRSPLAAVVASAAVWAAIVPAASAADSYVASDGFDRSSSTSWASAPTGGSWSVTGGTGVSVSAGAGVISGVQPGRSFYALLASTSMSDGWVKATFVAPQAGEFYYGVDVRQQRDRSAYRGRARIDARGQLHAEIMRRSRGTETVLAQKTLGAVQPGQSVSVLVSASGTSPVTVNAKAYLAGTSEPAWQVTTRDSDAERVTGGGAVGVDGYLGAGNPTTVRTQSFLAGSYQSSTPPPPPPPPAPVVTPAAGDRGSAAVGSTSYPVPAGAVFVATSGNDAAAGTQSAPLRTVTKALTKAHSKGTIVVRGGTYHEYFIVPPGKDVTIQSYPREAVWFDGSSTVSGFSPSGSTWKVDNWTTQFDSSPTYSKGAPDGTAPGWRFLDPAHPMAAHPDGVWINGAEQQQVGSLAQVRSGTFFVDYGAKRLYLGSDPTGKSVQASTLSQAVSLRAPGTLIRGVGFRRYADSVWQQGVITAYYPNMHLENVEVDDSATAGIGLYATGCSLKNVSILRSGQMGLQAGYADGLSLDNLAIRDSNDERFSPTPSAGGIKITTTRGVSLKNSEISRTTGNQFWTDQSVYDIALVNNTISSGSRYGIVLEISSKAVVANNVLRDNAFAGLFITNTDNVAVWNNTVVGNGTAAVSLTQDSRRITDLSLSGHDKRRPQPDLSMPWVVKNVVLGNNIYSPGSTSVTMFEVQSWEHVFSGNDMVSASDGNVFAQPAPGTPKAVTTWGRKGTWAANYSTLKEYVAATGRDRTSFSLTGSPVNGSSQPTSAVTSRESAVAQPLPAAVAGLVGKPSGSRHLGAWR